MTNLELQIICLDKRWATSDEYRFWLVWKKDDRTPTAEGAYLQLALLSLITDFCIYQWFPDLHQRLHRNKLHAWRGERAWEAWQLLNFSFTQTSYCKLYPKCTNRTVKNNQSHPPPPLTEFNVKLTFPKRSFKMAQPFPWSSTKGITNRLDVSSAIPGISMVPHLSLQGKQEECVLVCSAHFVLAVPLWLSAEEIKENHEVMFFLWFLLTRQTADCITKCHGVYLLSLRTLA